MSLFVKPEGLIVKIMRKIGTLVACCALALGLGAPAYAAEKEPIRIGLLLSLSGPAAPFGIPERNAIQILTKRINEQGGVNGRPIELIVYDDETNPTQAARGVRQLIRQEKVVTVIGSTIGSGTLAAAPIAMQNKVPMMAPNGTVAITAKDKPFYHWVFRSLPSDTEMTLVLLEHATAGGKNKVGLYYQEDAYGQTMFEYLRKIVKEYGVEVVAVASAPVTATDMTPQAMRLRNANPDVVLIQASAPSNGAAFVRAAAQVGLSAPLWAQTGLAQQAFIDASGPAGVGVKTVPMFNWHDPSPKLAEFAKILRDNGHEPTGFGEVIGSNALLAVVAAAKSIDGEITGETMRDALENLCPLETYQVGSACYSADNHDGWTREGMEPVVIHEGKFKRVE